jgi:hypothetical protein
MVQSAGQPRRFALARDVRWYGLLPILLSLGVPFLLADDWHCLLLSALLIVIIFFLPGYFFLRLASGQANGLLALLSPIFGIVAITNLFDVFALTSIGAYFLYVAIIFAMGGLALFLGQIKSLSTELRSNERAREAAVAGGAVALCISPLFWRSGRFSEDQFVFYGPAGQDHLYHLTLLERLLHQVPPDNFIVSGLRAPVYHYFNDLSLALILRTQAALHLPLNLFDLYYRCYPVLLYFLLGALAYRVGRQLLGSVRGGILSVLMILGAGGLSWFFGLLQTAVHLSHFSAARPLLFSNWTRWDGVGSVLSLVHRPAQYQGLLFCLAAITMLLRPEHTRRDWVLGGLLLGLMAGFNFTLAATFGIAAVAGGLILLAVRRQPEARDLAWLAVCIFIGSLPMNAEMLLSGMHQTAPGMVLRGPNLEFPMKVWGPLLGRLMPGGVLPWACLIVLPIVAYGIRLFGLRSLALGDMGGQRYRGLATVLALAFAFSFVVGFFFTYQGIGGEGISVIFLQPTLWILALFSLRPIHSWLERRRGNWMAVGLWALLGLTWVQALAAFNFSYKIEFDRETARVLQDIRSTSAPDEVVAFLPSDVAATPVWGKSIHVPHYAIPAMTGLAGYFLTEDYSKFYAAPGLKGRDANEVLTKAESLYRQRRGNIEAFLQGTITMAARAQLASDHVRWIVVEGDARRYIASSEAPWRKTDEMVVYRLSW